MQTVEWLNRLEAELIPRHYRSRVTKNVPASWRFYRKGPYVFAAVPYEEVPANDYGNKYVKSKVREIVFTLPLIAEKGLFLLHHGPADAWGPHKAQHKVDKTALRPVIMQSIHYVDPATGENYNSRTAWGPIKFGFCTEVIATIERLCGKPAETQP